MTSTPKPLDVIGAEAPDGCADCQAPAALHHSSDGEVAWVRCTGCGAEGTLEYRDDLAIFHWNNGKRRTFAEQSGATATRFISPAVARSLPCCPERPAMTRAMPLRARAATATPLKASGFSCKHGIPIARVRG